MKPKRRLLLLLIIPLNPVEPLVKEQTHEKIEEIANPMPPPPPPPPPQPSSLPTPSTGARSSAPLPPEPATAATPRAPHRPLTPLPDAIALSHSVDPFFPSPGGRTKQTDNGNDESHGERPSTDLEAAHRPAWPIVASPPGQWTVRHPPASALACGGGFLPPAPMRGVRFYPGRRKICISLG
ncbi:hypothetical protein BDA96_07G162800 [Sorghum bicolor]|uniref:Uncharacterized protein n=2 Tax=Sorghum bicolor TaxID=4558 RepID=A0A921U9X9_SORBI|nr:hypothetical protein BDA96_07G162800 [Sorghum bicolor]OQU80609.1 hypothetical protein SORBI_3007G151650 [Sorghum bicolor]